jgi:hypothetical protein
MKMPQTQEKERENQIERWVMAHGPCGTIAFLRAAAHTEQSLCLN